MFQKGICQNLELQSVDSRAVQDTLKFDQYSLCNNYVTNARLEILGHLHELEIFLLNGGAGGVSTTRGT